MPPRSRILLALSALTLLIPLIPLDSVGSERSAQQLTEHSYRTHWTLFGGLSGGLSTVSGGDFSKNPKGSQYSLGLGLSYEKARWVYDIGASWLSSKITGATPGTESIGIHTRSGMGDLSARYRLGERWQIGPVVNNLFGTDTGFGPSVGNSIGTWFVGLKTVYEFPFDRFPVRLTQQISTDISIPDRQATLAFIGVQIGLPIRASSSSGSGSPGNTPDVIRTRSAAPAGPFTVVLDPQKVFFKTNSAELRPEVKAILQDVGVYLHEKSTTWESLEISGHADQRGSYKYNLALSEKRANSVSKVLRSGGIQALKIHTQAYSFSKPLDEAKDLKAFAKNRRVELVFNQFQDPQVLIEKLRPLMKLSEAKESN
ncbi:MAG: OmpA family protein [Methylotenera sp.]|nr:OmpA family protein [Oligoflexia bacterium]